MPVSKPSSNSAPLPNRRRSQRVLLRMPILVIARGPDQQHVSENTFTSVVNAHGALIQLSLKVQVGQKILIRNPESMEEQFVRVIHVTPGSNGKLNAGIEFLKAAPKFWRISFPPDDWVPQEPEITADTF